MSKFNKPLQRFKPFKPTSGKGRPFTKSADYLQLIYLVNNYAFYLKQRFYCLGVHQCSGNSNVFLLSEPGVPFCNMFYLAKTYATSANTFGKKSSSGVRLPSGIHLKGIPFILTCSFVKKKTTLLGKKSSTFFFKKKRISVRGVAKNSVDHKHGGKGRGGVLRNF